MSWAVDILWPLAGNQDVTLAGLPVAVVFFLLMRWAWKQGQR